MLKTVQYAAIAFLLLTLIAMGLFHKQISGFFNKKKSDPPQTEPTTPAGLDLNKALKLGVYNSAEVRQLQEWLGGIDMDGDFGPKTEARLLEVKGIKETTLANYPKTPVKSNTTTGTPDKDHDFDFFSPSTWTWGWE